MKPRPSTRYAAAAGAAVFITAILSIPVWAFLWDPYPDAMLMTQMERLEAYAIWNLTLGVVASLATAALVGLWVENYRVIRSLFSGQGHNSSS